MFGLEQFLTLNRWLTGFWRLAWLNVLWSVVTVLGLGVLGVGPASYALAKYLDRWFRHGQTPPPARTFFRDARELGWHPVRMGLVLQAAGAVILVNLLSLNNWYLHAANLAALVVLGVITAYVFAVMVTLDLRGLRAQLSGALMLGIGSLHWTVLGTTAVLIGYGLMFRFAVPLLALLGAALPFFVVTLVVRRILRDLEPAGTPDGAAQADAAAGLSLPAPAVPDLPRPLARPARRTDALVRRPSSASDRANPLRKGTPA